MNATPTPAPVPAGRAPGAGAAAWTLAGITVTRLFRSKALWLCVLFAALPVGFAVIMHALRVTPFYNDIFVLWRLILALLAAMLVASSIGEDIEDRTGTYLWSRPIARWAVLAGKLCALSPFVVALVVASWCATIGVWTSAAPSAASCLGLAAGAAAACMVAAGISTLVPRHAMALTIGYMLVDNFIAAWPFSLRELMIAHQTTALAGLADDRAIATPLIALAAIAAVWVAIGLLRIRRIEV
jgi:ABC-type transport system involved in multi-copper enzyme maturation permease subunit